MGNCSFLADDGKETEENILTKFLKLAYQTYLDVQYNWREKERGNRNIKEYYKSIIRTY